MTPGVLKTLILLLIREWRCSSLIRRFMEIIEELHQQNLLMADGPFIQCDGLDRFIISKELENHFSGLIQSVLPKLSSNHFPIFLDGCGMRRGKMLFRFENTSLKVKGFKHQVRNQWVGYNVRGSFQHILEAKLECQDKTENYEITRCLGMS